MDRKEAWAKEFEEKLDEHVFDVQSSELDVKRMTALLVELADEMEHFITKNDTVQEAQCQTLLLGQAVAAYFDDLVKESVKPTDDIKTLAYLAYWLLKLKPLQLKGEKSFSKEKAKTLLCLNESFVTAYIFSHLIDENAPEEQLSQALKETIHFFKSALCTPLSIEAMLLVMITRLTGTK